MLAAGMGTRLGAEGIVKPKGFIELGGRTLIEHSIQKLKACGVTSTIIVTGHQKQFYEKFAEAFSDASFSIKCCYNEEYATTGTMHSFYKAKAMLEELNTSSFLLLESDIIYRQSALKALQEDPRKNIILATSATNAGDEVYIDASELDDRVQNISKDKGALKTVHSEFVCITKFSMNAFQEMCKLYKNGFEANPYLKAEYGRYGIVNICKEVPFYALRLPFADCPWTEVDTVEQQERAKELVDLILSDK
ncbi:MAG: phosphocholine cytidylyltransferase family protein [Alphaproteobacteria bacterium]